MNRPMLLLFSLLPAAISLSSCASVQRGGAEQALIQSLDRMSEHQSFAYEGTALIQGAAGTSRQSSFEGIVRGPNDTYIRLGTAQAGNTQKPGQSDWVKMAGAAGPSDSPQSAMNPQPLLTLLRQAKKSVTWDPASGSANVLNVKVDSAEAKDFVWQGWQEQLRLMADSERSRIAAESTRLTPAQIESWQADVTQATDRTAALLNDKKQSMQVDMSCQIQLDAASGLPKSLSAVHRYLRTDTAQPQEEQHTYRFAFTDFGGDIALPSVSPKP